MFIHDVRDAVSVFQQIFNPTALTAANGDVFIAALDDAACALLAVQHAAPRSDVGVAVGELFVAAQFGPDEARVRGGPSSDPRRSHRTATARMELDVSRSSLPR
jgi:hypothetical protein